MKTKPMSSGEMDDFRIDIERRLGKIQGGLDVNNALLGELTKDVVGLLAVVERQQGQINSLQMSIVKILTLAGIAGSACSIIVSVGVRVFIG